MGIEKSDSGDERSSLLKKFNMSIFGIIGYNGRNNSELVDYLKYYREYHNNTLDK